MKKIVVTGGAGFIGSHLVDRLLEEGNGVVVLDNLTTGRRENLEVHKGNSKLQIIEHNVISPIDLKGISQIYHLACPASPIHYKAYPIQTLKTNFLGTLNMLELAQKNSASLPYRRKKRAGAADIA